MISSLTCLALAIYFEARGEPIDGKLAVVDVILERVKDPRWPNSICEVIKQPKQFSFYNNYTRLVIVDITAYRAATTIAYHVVSGYTPGLVEANHYHTKDVNPMWNKKMHLVMEVGNHLYYKN